jgi:hypothetical protein
LRISPTDQCSIQSLAYNYYILHNYNSKRNDGFFGFFQRSRDCGNLKFENQPGIQASLKQELIRCCRLDPLPLIGAARTA